jgi:hypothetical protein
MPRSCRGRPAHVRLTRGRRGSGTGCRYRRPVVRGRGLSAAPPLSGNDRSRGSEPPLSMDGEKPLAISYRRGDKTPQQLERALNEGECGVVYGSVDADKPGAPTDEEGQIVNPIECTLEASRVIPPPALPRTKQEVAGVRARRTLPGRRSCLGRSLVIVAAPHSPRAGLAQPNPGPRLQGLKGLRVRNAQPTNRIVGAQQGATARSSLLGHLDWRRGIRRSRERVACAGGSFQVHETTIASNCH